MALLFYAKSKNQVGRDFGFSVILLLVQFSKFDSILGTLGPKMAKYFTGKITMTE